nr:MAG TPA: hypothetical protein [Bacteriophage sp.]
MTTVNLEVFMNINDLQLYHFKYIQNESQEIIYKNLKHIT